jgi:hypothetical protein
VADKFILIDGNGNETSNKGQAVAVAVDMTSLLDYNRQNNFNTLVSYGFVKGDILRILDDCYLYNTRLVNLLSSNLLNNKSLN